MIKIMSTGQEKRLTSEAPTIKPEEGERREDRKNGNNCSVKLKTYKFNQKAIGSKVFIFHIFLFLKIGLFY